MLRGDSAINKSNIIKELGDVLWAISLSVDMYGQDLKSICDKAKPRTKIRTAKSAEMAALDLDTKSSVAANTMYYDNIKSMNMKSFVSMIEKIKQLAEYVGMTLEGIAWANWDKLTDRQRRDVIHDNGHGDLR